MTEATQHDLIVTLGPILFIVVSHFFSNRKLNIITELSNSMLTHQVSKKEEIEHKLEQTKDEELSRARAKIIDLEKQVNLLTPILKNEPFKNS